ncbi:MAG: enoyl-CoA hydratase/isomerase family protein [Burkholderiales bacterium]
MTDTLGIERRGRLAIVRMNRPERRNALSIDAMLELTRCANALALDTAIDVVILTGTTQWFSAGADLKDTARWDALSKPLVEARDIAGVGYRMARAWEEMPQITVAAIEGYAIGGGIALALACDWRVAASDAFISLPEIGLGIPLTWGTLARLVALAGPATAKRLTILCERIDAPEAKSMGILDYLTPKGGAFDKAIAIADQVLAKPRAVVRMSKETINATAFTLAHLASHAAADQFTLAANSEESREARARFGKP